MPKICKQVNCNNEAIKVENHWSDDEYCAKCISLIEQAADGMREEIALNMSMYGNKTGMIRTERKRK